MKWAIVLLTIGFMMPARAATKTETHWLYNQTLNTIIISNNSAEIRPIASITKLMTAMVALDYSLDMDRKIKMYRNLRSFLPSQEHKRSDVLSAMIIRSDNSAAETMAADYPGGRIAFLAAMNAKAASLGMVNTNFVDPSGLTKNVSTAEDVSKMVLEASKYPLIRQLSTTQEKSVEVEAKKKIKTIMLVNTNKSMLFEFDNLIASKTGLTSIAGWCVAMVVESNGQRYTLVVLGAKNKLERLRTVERIMYNDIIGKPR